MSGDTKEGFVTLRLPDDLKAAIEALATKNERSRSAEMRVALTQYVERAA